MKKTAEQCIFKLFNIRLKSFYWGNTFIYEIVLLEKLRYL